MINNLNTSQIIMLIVIFLCFVGFYAILWGNRTFSVKTLNQIIFHLKVPMDGTDEGIFKDLFLNTFFQSLGSTLIVALVLLNPLGSFTREHTSLIIILSLILIAIIALNNYKIPQYILCLIRKTDLYEKHYQDPRETNLSFPSKKRNLIHVVLESVENTYLDEASGGSGSNNYIKELGQLAKSNINFSYNDKIGGPLTIEGTQWTIASQVAQEAGVPLLLQPNSKKYDDETSFFPGLFSLGEVLEKQGYVNEILMGSESKFAGTYNFFKQHGNYKIVDHPTAIEEGRLEKGYHVFWGYEDKKLFEFAKEDITKIVKEDKPFNIEIVTIDTHTPDGYVCDDCHNTYDKQYANVIDCQSRMVNEFISWCKKQPFYDNTTIMITGDHNSMSEKFFTDLKKNYIRTPYNCFINSAVEPNQSKNRKFTTFDYYPTILASMGVKIDGDRLGLGVNLFGDKKTLVEEFGYQRISDEVRKRSDYYQNTIIKGKK